MNNVHDRGLTTDMQRARWGAAAPTKREEETPMRRVGRHPAVFCAAVYFLLAIVALAILKSIGALQPFLG